MGRENLKVLIALAFVVVFVGIVFPLAMLFVFGGADTTDPEGMENLVKFWSYGIISIVMLLYVVVERLIHAKFPNVFPYADSIVHEPERPGAILGRFSFIKDPVYLIGGFLILTTFVSMFSVATNTFVVAPAEFQIEPIAKLGLATEPAATAETLLFFVVLLPTVIGVVYHGPLNKKQLWAAALIGIVVVGLLAFPAWHWLRYGEQQTNIVAVAGFGVIGSTLTVMTGSAIPIWTWHETNNFFHKMKCFDRVVDDAGRTSCKSLMDNELLVFVMQGSTILLVGIILFLYWNWKRKKRPG